VTFSKAVTVRGKHYYPHQTELRAERLADPGWNCAVEAANWGRKIRD